VREREGGREGGRERETFCDVAFVSYAQIIQRTFSRTLPKKWRYVGFFFSTNNFFLTHTRTHTHTHTHTPEQGQDRDKRDRGALGKFH
jgi:hypothetical protein